MTHSHLLFAVALATGETFRTVERLGFRHEQRREEPITNDHVAAIDCPCCGGTVVVAWNPSDDLPEFADCRRCETVVPFSDDEVYEINLLDVAVSEPRTYAPAA